MPRFETWGFLSDNELFAMKKNVGEQTKLREKLGSLSLELNFTEDNLRHGIKSIRQDLKEIRQSTGHSPKGLTTIIPVSQIKSSFPAYAVPPIVFDRIIHSSYGQNVDFRLPKLTKQKKSVVKIRAVTGKDRSKSELIYLTNDIKRNVKSVGEFLDIEKTTNKTESVDSLRKDSKAFMQYSCKREFQKVEKKPEDAKMCTDKSHLKSKTVISPSKSEFSSNCKDDVFIEKAVEIPTENLKSKASNSNVASGDTSIQVTTIVNEDDPEDSKATSTPWQTRHRNGRKIDPYELPQIKDCYRPMCRFNCLTCLSRKMKAPCFLVPGVNVSHDHFHDNENEVDVQNKETMPDKIKISKIKKDEMIVKETENITGDNSEVKDGIEFLKKELSFFSECLAIKRKTVEKKISKKRLVELAIPKEGFRKELRFSKTFIKKNLEKMKKSDPHDLLTAAERRRLHKVQGHIDLFIAVLNDRKRSHVKPINEILDFPIREDSNIDHSHLRQTVLSSLYIPPKNRKRKKVHF